MRLDASKRFVSDVPVEFLSEIPECRVQYVLSDLTFRRIPYRTEYNCGIVRVFVQRELESVIALAEIVQKYFVDEY